MEYLSLMTQTMKKNIEMKHNTMAQWQITQEVTNLPAVEDLPVDPLVAIPKDPLVVTLKDLPEGLLVANHLDNRKVRFAIDLIES
jgi:hypothetical protein